MLKYLTPSKTLKSIKHTIFFRCIFFGISFLCCGKATFCQSPQGLPFITNFSPKLYEGHPQNWDIAQDSNGVMFFANSLGLLAYDGESWKLTLDDKLAVVRSLKIDGDGRIYVGSATEFGYFQQDSLSQWKYHSLTYLVPGDKRDFNDIWTVHITNEGIYFQARERLFRISGQGQNGEQDQWILKMWEPEFDFLYAFYLDGEYFIHQREVGMMKMVDDELVFIPGSEVLAYDRMNIMLPFHSPESPPGTQKKYLLGQFRNGFYTWDENHFEPFESPINDVSQQYFVYKGGRYGDNRFILSTVGSGIAIIDHQGNVIERIDKSLGLYDNSVYAVFTDKNDLVWLGLDNGICRIELGSPLTIFSENYGINTSILSIQRHEGILYLGTTNGLFKQNPKTGLFEQNTIIPFNQIFDLEIINNELFVPADGLFSIANGQVQIIQASVAGEFQTSSLNQSVFNPAIIFAGLQNGLGVFKNMGTELSSDWRFMGPVPGVTENIWKIAESSENTVWIGTQNKRVISVSNLNFNEDEKLFDDVLIERYDTTQGLANAQITPYRFKNNILFSTPKGTLIFDEEQKLFFPDTTFTGPVTGISTAGDPTEYSFVKDHKGRIWMNFGAETGLAYPLEDGTFRIEKIPFLPFADNSTVDIFPEENGITWFATFDGLIRYDENKSKVYDRPFKTIICNVTNSDQQVPFQNKPGQKIASFNFKNNSFHFDFSAPFYEQENKTIFQTFLEGFDRQWSGWNKLSQKEYTNLSHGKYTFHVHARNVYNQISHEATYSFQILTPWYLSWWAIIMYIFLGAGLIISIIRWRTKQLKQKSAELEIEIANRTKEIQQRLEELAVINSVQKGLVAQMDMKGIYTLVGDQIRDVFDAQIVVINTFDMKSNLNHYKYAYEKGQVFEIDPVPLKDLYQKLIQTAKPIVINSNWRSNIKEYGITSAIEGEVPKCGLWVPMVVGDKVVGSVSLQNVDHENAFSESDVKLLSTLTNSMAVALENARLFEETNRLLAEVQLRAKELAVINGIQEGLVAQINIQGIYDLVGDKIQDIFDSQAVTICNYAHEKQLMEFKYVFEKGKRHYTDDMPLNATHKQIIKSKKILLVNDNLTKYLEENGIEVIPGTQMPKSMVFVPMVVGNTVKGSISLQNLDHEFAFTDSDLNLLTTLANTMSIALENARLFDEANRLLEEANNRAEELAIINKVQEGLVEQMDSQGIYEFVGKQLANMVDTQTIVISSFDHVEQIENFHYASRDGDVFTIGPRSFDNFTRQVLKLRGSLVVNQNFEEYIQGIIKTKDPQWDYPKSAVFVPITKGDNVVGNVSLQNTKKENVFKDSHVNLLDTIVKSMSVALDNARLFEETEIRAAEMSTVNSLSHAMASNLDLDDLMKMTGDKMQELFKADIVYIAMLNRNTNMITFPYQYGDNMAPFRYGEGLTSDIIKNKRSSLLNKDVAARHKELGIDRIGIQSASYLGVPIMSGADVLGVLSVQSTKEINRFSESDMHLLETIAANVGIAIHNAQLFEEAEKSRSMAEQANEAKSAFLSTVSHELRTPLTSVLGFAKIIKKRLEERIIPALDVSDQKMERVVRQVSENLSVVVSEGQRLTKLINDVLDLAKIEAGKIEWHMEDINMEVIIERAISATTSLFHDKKLQFETALEPFLPQIYGDQDKLIQVVINLLSNAVKFTEKGAIKCNVKRKDDELIVSVEDSGIGISEEDKPKVFEKFKQVGDTLTDKPQGTGLGLPISKEIIEHHGGSIWLESERGKGSIFYFSIPLKFEKLDKKVTYKLDEIINELEKNLAGAQNFQVLNGKSILVIDDEEHIRELLDQELTSSGYVVSTASNGRKGLDIIRQNQPDLIILDVMMPEMNGFDVAAIVKNDPQTKDIPIIILSIVQDKQRGYGIGIDKYMTKPIEMEELFNSISSLLGQGKSKRKVMIVDEDASTVNTLMGALEKKGYQAVEANGKDLRDKALASKPDIIIVKSSAEENQETVKSLRLEKGLENVLVLVYE